MVIKQADFALKSNSVFLFDTNIWMFLFCPIADSKKYKQQSASKLFERILSGNQNKIILTSSILSEFANAYLRLDYKLWKESSQKYSASFKHDYFNSKHGMETRKTIHNIIFNKILKFSVQFPDSFNSFEWNAFFKIYESLDFNDSLYYYLCKKNNWIFVSDDSDFEILNDNVLTIKL